MEWVLCWTGGGKERRTVFYRRTEEGRAGTTFVREEATRFATAWAARFRWLRMHAVPAEYVEALETGAARAELVEVPELGL